jgi:hypothetical protein
MFGQPSSTPYHAVTGGADFTALHIAAANFTGTPAAFF